MSGEYRSHHQRRPRAIAISLVQVDASRRFMARVVMSAAAALAVIEASLLVQAALASH